MWLLTKPQILEENNLYTETTLKQEPEVLWFYKTCNSEPADISTMEYPLKQWLTLIPYTM